MKTKITLFFLFITVSGQWVAGQNCITFDSHLYGTQYGYVENIVNNQPGDIIFTENNIPVSVETFHWYSGTTFGFGQIDSTPSNCLGFLVLGLNNLNIRFHFNTQANQVRKVTIQYHSLGGYENLGINSTIPCFVGELNHYIGTCPAEFSVTVDTLSACRKVTITGLIDDVMIGGQEFYIDSICTFYSAGIDEKGISTGIGPNYPNPVYESTTIPFRLNPAGDVVIKIMNCMGREIKTLTNEYYPAGDHAVKWNGTDQYGARVPSGIYFYQVQAGNKIWTGKMSVIM